MLNKLARQYFGPRDEGICVVMATICSYYFQAKGGKSEALGIGIRLD